MDDNALDTLRREFHIRSEKEVSLLRADLEATVSLLQAILNKPDNLYINLDWDDETSGAYWEQYEWKEAFEGTGKGRHQIVTNTYEARPLSYAYARLLDDFFVAASLKHHDIELPQVETKGLSRFSCGKCRTCV